jgi:sugar/nucleoside kinase (ribokinase family)
VDTSQVEIDPQLSTGFMLKSRSVDGSDPAIEYYRRGSAASQLSVAHLQTDYALRARHVHTTGITPALSPAARELVAHAMQTLRAAGHSVSFDPNLRPSLWPNVATMRDTLNDLARHADWVLPGIDEGKLLTEQKTPADIAAWYLDRGAKAVVIKQGAEGAYFRTASGEQGQVPGVPVPLVVDTVGAGDAFAVGIISAQLEGLGWPQALRRANWIASRALQVVGDMEGLPTRAELSAQNLE